MASCRRSGRARKKVDYSLKDDSPQDGSDDDFQDSPSAPPPKKARTSTKPKAKEDKGKKEVTLQSTKKKERLSLDEKLYQRELEAAIEASIKDSQSEDETHITQPLNRGKQNNKVATKTKQDATCRTDVDCNKENDKSSETKAQEKPSGSKDQGDDESIVHKAKQSAAEPKVLKDDSDEDMSETNSNSHADSDFEEDAGDADDDSDFDAEMEQKSKKKRERKSARSACAVVASPPKPTVKPRASVTVTPIKMMKKQQKAKSKNSSAATSTKSISSVSSSASNSPSIVPRNTPLSVSTKIRSPMLGRSSPGLGLGGVNIKSSGAPLRLGLSRNVRVKPLHSNVTIQR